ncbi:MAG: undecaprenyldiphospho-muramoylpentapeptide beta-N-acetylglucosaminyltransferase [Clostridia bacterium]|nr:undecaprenyldiphospho-muramoylpentapeptide beta-N-acetylglucosaminyltransferase [Clostridia bacterium]
MKILFATGGTGGHINPALAVAGRIREMYGDEAEILFVGTPTHMETKLVPQAGFNLKTVDVRGFYRALTWNNIKRDSVAFIKMFTSSIEAKKIIKEFNPDVAIGFGGYVSGPVIRKAHQLGVPTALHEQNAFPGITNKALAKVVDCVMLTSEDALERIQSNVEPVITGLPVRGELIAADRKKCREELGIPDDKILILSMGGSLGADAINNAMIELITAEKDNDKLMFIHAMGQYGLYVPEKLEENGVDLEAHPNIVLREYIDDMQRCMPAADIVICRSGASSLYEIRALGKASILIPSPNVAENHQYYNAMELVNNDAALIIEEKDLTGEKLVETAESLINDPERIKTIEKNAKSMAILDATDRITTNLLNLIKKD